MRVDRDAAAVVGNGEEAVGVHFHFDEGGVPGQRLVHGVVDHLGEQMMQRLFVGAADIHAGPAPYRLEPFEHLDVGGGVAVLGAGAAGRGLGRRPALQLLRTEQVIVRPRFDISFQWFRHGFSCVARAQSAANRFP